MLLHYKQEFRMGSSEKQVVTFQQYAEYKTCKIIAILCNKVLLFYAVEFRIR